jgi:WD40 repeat protein
MTDARTSLPSIAGSARRLAAGAPVVAVRFLGAAAFFALGEEAILVVARDTEPQRLNVHAGAIIAVAGDRERMLTAGDDGKVVATNAAGETRTLVTDPRRRWIDRLASGPDGTIAWSIGKAAFVQTARREEKTLELPSSAGGLAFAPKGFRLAVAHYNGVLLWFPNAVGAAPERLEWKGSHLDVTFSPDARFLITAMQEPVLHGWRLADRKDMRMAGYGAKVRSLGWTADGQWLATSGSEQIVLWPFQGKDGPMGKAPRLIAPHDARVAVVACHPREGIVAAGYDNGLVLMAQIADGAEIVAKEPGSTPVTALAWDAAGDRIAWGTEDGEAGIIDLA